MTLAALQQCKFGHLEEYLGFWLCHEHQGRKWLGQQSPVCGRGGGDGGGHRPQHRAGRGPVGRRGCPGAARRGRQVARGVGPADHPRREGAADDTPRRMVHRQTRCDAGAVMITVDLDNGSVAVPAGRDTEVKVDVARPGVRVDIIAWTQQQWLEEVLA